MHIILLIIFLKKVSNTTETLIIYLLSNNKYINIPIKIPKNIYNLISPLLNLNIEYKIKQPVKSQNTISSKHVIKSFVLKTLLNILKKSNSVPIKSPLIVNTINK